MTRPVGIARAVRTAAAALGAAAGGAVLAGCGDASEGGGGSGEGTVFTDTARFREVCLEADSGLTIAAGRCTPRDQGNPIP